MDRLNRDFESYNFKTNLDYCAVQMENFVKMANIGNMVNESEEPFILQFIHIPKNAGTSISIAGQTLGWGIYFPIPREIKIPKIGAFCHVPIRYWDQNPYQNFKLFAVVRNPYDRILSEFKHQLTITNIIKKYEISTTFFNLWLNDKFRLLETYKHLDDNHFLPQSEYIFDEYGNQIVEHVLYFENLATEFDQLMDQYHLYTKLKHENIGHRTDITIDDISDENLEKINNYYQDDFINFGYIMISID